MKILKFLIFLIIPMTTNAQLKIAVPDLSQSLNNLDIHSVSDYVVFDDLLRPLVKFDSNGEIAPDLVESWEVKDKFKKYIFKLKKNQFFSDSSPINATEVINSLDLLIKHPDIIHGDGKKIKKVASLDEYTFSIELYNEDPFFLTELSSPEYRIKKTNSLKYNITSGPYFIEKIENNKKIKLKLKLNQKYPFTTEVKFKEIEYTSYDAKNFLKSDVFKNYDLIWPDSSLNSHEIQQIKNQDFTQYQLSLGFSYWLSINPNTLNLQQRVFVKTKLDAIFNSTSFFSDNNIVRSKQLFLPLGPGRLNEKEIKEIELTLKQIEPSTTKKLKLLLPKNVQKQLLEDIAKALPNSEVHFFTNFLEYSKLIKTNTFDLALVNNDLSSIDLRSSIMVTFNPSRPLVWLDKNNIEINNLVKDINKEVVSTKRYAHIKTLSQKLLENVIIYPVYCDYGYIFVKKGIDLSLLNKSGAETFSWKIK